jgi:hypothetical protein
MEKIGSFQGKEIGAFHRDGIGRAGHAIEERHFAEKVARAEDRQDDLISLLRGKNDLDASGADDIERRSDVPLLKEDFTFFDHPRPERSCQEPVIGRMQAGEKGNTSEKIFDAHLLYPRFSKLESKPLIDALTIIAPIDAIFLFYECG